MHYDYLIVGAGLFGAVFACEAKRRGKRCLVVEKRNHVAGNAHTEELAGIQVHRYGAHIFHTPDKEVWEYVNAHAAFRPFVNAPIAVYGDEVYNLPFNMNTFNRMWGVRTPDEARERIARQIAAEGIETPANLEEQAIRLVGRDIYEKLIRGYTEKQWGRPCRELPPFIIQRLPVRFTYDNNYFNDRYQGIPEDGYTRLAETLLVGAEVLLETDYFAFRQTHPKLARRTVYTGPIDRYFDACYGALEYRSLRFETKLLDTDNYQGNAVVNYTAADVPYTRCIEHKHFLPGGGQEKSAVTWEYPADWTADAEPYYPVNDDRNAALYEKYRALAAREAEVVFGGRLGAYRYYNMDQVVRSALDLAARECGASC